MPAALYYHPEAYSTSGPKLMGRHAAGESFLRGFLTHVRADAFWVQVQTAAHARHFAETARAFHRAEPITAVDKTSLGALTQAGAVFYPGPGIAAFAWQRAGFGHGAWSLCGITHTTSSAGAMDALADLITAPVQPWDAVICTSAAVKDNVTRLLQAQVDYLKGRLGISRLVLPQLPVIPLGLHTRDFAFSADQKLAARARLGVGDDGLMVLFMGRLSFHAKAHPLAMYQALEMAAQATGRQVTLVECGWHANEFIAKAYAEASRRACPSVRVVALDGRKAEDRQAAWAGADLFCSLSDNIQETFGIVPIEAMAAGLPVVVSDWDGYRDTVRDGIDGFRIPTLMPGAGMGGDLAQRHALEIDTYDMYCGHTCSLVAVDVLATAAAFTRLFDSSDLRRQMGQAGQTRAREVYDWKPIIGQYEALWSHLHDLRASQAKDLPALSHPWPARLDPFHAFGAYPTQSLGPQTVLTLVPADAEAAVRQLRAWRDLAMVDFAQAILPTDAEIGAVLQQAATGPQPAADLVASITPNRRPVAFRALAWLVKLGILRPMA